MLNWLKKLLAKWRPWSEPAHGTSTMPGLDPDGPFVPNQRGITVDLDRLTPGARDAIMQEMLRRQKGAPLFSGTVEHGYALAKVGTPDRCPRCAAPTQRRCAQFIYGTDHGTRVMLAPAGHFCSACPTVIVDESIIVAGAKRGCKFWSVLGIHHDDQDGADFFRTWNGQRTTYVIDEEDGTVDLAAGEAAGPPPPPPPRPPGDRQRRQRKRRLEKLARKRNRRP
jgi:hypothetical protein